MESISSSVEAVESEAQKILESARTRANEILLEARETAKKISSSKLSMDDVQVESLNITHSASEEAKRKIEASHSESDQLETRAGKKVNELVELIFNIVTGVGK
ncbi:hypothetical protein ACFLWC_06630 [Chloroflexota bacterium]